MVDAATKQVSRFFQKSVEFRLSKATLRTGFNRPTVIGAFGLYCYGRHKLQISVEDFTISLMLDLGEFTENGCTQVRP